MDNNKTDESESVLLRYSTNKAGMDGLDKATITKTILENSKGSKFYENQLRRERILQSQIAQKLDQVKKLTPLDLKTGETEVDLLMAKLRSCQRFDRTVVHIDMDAFYAAVEIRDKPELRHLPVAVGGNSMLATSNYIARRFGVRAGLPGFLGKKLCPHLHIISSDFGRYTQVSHEVRRVLRLYASVGTCSDSVVDSDLGPVVNGTDRVAMVTTSLDEAYLDLTRHLIERQSLCRSKKSNTRKSRSSQPRHQTVSVEDTQSIADQTNSCQPSSNTESSEESKEAIPDRQPRPADDELAVCEQCGLLVKSGRRTFGLSAWDAVREIRFRIFCATRLTCSAGIGPNTLIAKIASDWYKPCGQHEVESNFDSVARFMHNLPIRKVPGIGHVSERKLEAFSINVCSDLIKHRGLLWHVSSRSSINYYVRIAVGHSEDDWLPESLVQLGQMVIDSTDSTVDPAVGQPEIDRKSMSIERTFHDTSNLVELVEKCRSLASSLSSDLKEAHIKGRLLTIKMKLDTFEVRNRSQPLPDHTNDGELLGTFAAELLTDEYHSHERNLRQSQQPSAAASSSSVKPNIKPLTLRLMGIRLSNLLPTESCPQIRQHSIEEAFANIVGNPKTPCSSSLSLTKSDQRDDSEIKPDSTTSSDSHQPVVSQQGGPLLPTSQSSNSSLAWALITDKSDKRSSKPSSDSRLKFTCPVCCRCLAYPSEDDFNYHLDDCLSRGAIFEAVKETFASDNASSQSTTPKRSSIDLKSASSGKKKRMM